MAGQAPVSDMTTIPVPTYLIGFTGTRHGMTEAQIVSVTTTLLRLDLLEFHHGDCIGADVQAAEIAKAQGYIIVGHPPVNEYRRAFFFNDMTRTAKPYIERNHALVDAVGILIAAPETAREQHRSGTWATIRYAKSNNVRVIIINPDGRTIE